MCLLKMTVSNDGEEFVILVDEADRQIGVGPKLGSHQNAQLHRAFSIFIFDESGRTLIQKRADGKYHSGGLWANTCCGHPRPGEATADAARRRLYEELGFEAELTLGFSSRYKADLDHDMVENEYVHVYCGVSSARPVPEPTEVADIAYVGLEDLKDCSTYRDIDQTAWLRHYINHHYAQLVDMQRKCRLATISGLSTSNSAHGTEELLG